MATVLLDRNGLEIASELRKTKTRLVTAPSGVRLNDFYEMLVCEIEDLKEKIKELEAVTSVGPKFDPPVPVNEKEPLHVQE
jgi:hypothetical protein